MVSVAREVIEFLIEKTGNVFYVGIHICFNLNQLRVQHFDSTRPLSDDLLWFPLGVAIFNSFSFYRWLGNDVI